MERNVYDLIYKVALVEKDDPGNQEHINGTLKILKRYIDEYLEEHTNLDESNNVSGESMM